MKAPFQSKDQAHRSAGSTHQPDRPGRFYKQPDKAAGFQEGFARPDRFRRARYRQCHRAGFRGAFPGWLRGRSRGRYYHSAIRRHPADSLQPAGATALSDRAGHCGWRWRDCRPGFPSTVGLLLKTRWSYRFVSQVRPGFRPQTKAGPPSQTHQSAV